MVAEHRFLFEPDGSGTRIRSVESWRGLLATATKPVLKRLAERIGKQQLEGLRRAAMDRKP